MQHLALNFHTNKGAPPLRHDGADSVQTAKANPMKSFAAENFADDGRRAKKTTRSSRGKKSSPPLLTNSSTFHYTFDSSPSSAKCCFAFFPVFVLPCSMEHGSLVGTIGSYGSTSVRADPMRPLASKNEQLLRPTPYRGSFFLFSSLS